MSRIDRYYMMIISKYFQTSMDYYKLMMICKKYQEIPEMYHYNPIPMNEQVKKLFPNIETQYLYSSNEKRDNNFNLFKYCYSIKYSQYLQMKRPAYSFVKITCSKQDKKVIKQFPKEATHFGNEFFSDYQNQWNINLDDPDLFKNVIAFGDACFSGNNHITSIHLGRVRELPSKCFMNCVNLKEIDLSNVRIIGSDCFKGCTSLTAITLPVFLISGAKMCFGNLTNLINIKTAGLTQLRNKIDYSTARKFIANGIECKNFVLTPECISMFGLKIPDDPYLKSLPDNCFYSQRFTNITVPTNITQLKKGAFANCSELKYIDIRSVQTIGDECFKGCSSLTAITVGDLKSIGNYIFNECKNLKQVIPTTPIEWNGNESFFIASTINKTIKYKNKFIYKRIDAEISNNIPNGVQEIGSFCFNTQLLKKDLILPTTVTMIRSDAFSYVFGIENIDLSNVIKMESNCFQGILRIKSLKLSSKLDCDIDACFDLNLLSNKMIFEGSNEFLHYVSPNIQIALNKINVSAPFVRCGNFYTDFKSNNGEMEDDSCCNFRKYWSWEKNLISIPTTITKIGNKCFNNNEKCIFTIPHTVKTIGDGCFCNCKEVKIHLHKDTVIGNGCFKNSKYELHRYF